MATSATPTHPPDHSPHSQNRWLMGLGALGVVYGDIGTSPLYTVKECFGGSHGLGISQENVLGILSLVFWTIFAIVVVKYLFTVMRADNQKEGGIMSLMALVMQSDPKEKSGKGTSWIIYLGIFGASLLLGEGIITPVISVLSAVEGLEIVTPLFKPYIVPLTLGILIGLFLFQKRGTADVAKVFGPTMFLWFSVIGMTGLYWVIQNPVVLWALNPGYIVNHFVLHGWHGFFVLGSVILCVTGAEALYADMGHFGRGPITRAWFVLVYPALILNYFGQGGVVLALEKAAVGNPFYAMVPSWALLPMVVLATLATIIASQALISGAFSLAQQAVQLGYCPRLTIVHTSHQTEGQIYIPEVNFSLMTACCILTLGFQESSRLAAAYGIAVIGTMTITSLLLFFVMRDRWGWQPWKAYGFLALFLSVDLPYLLANLGKVRHGGWVPLVIGSVLFLFMTTWKKGRGMLSQAMQETFFPLAEFMKTLPKENPKRVRGTAVFMTSNRDVAPPVLLHSFRHNKVLHEKVLLLSIVTEKQPEVAYRDRVELSELGCGFHQVVARYGFMQNPNIPEILGRLKELGLKMNPMDVSFFLGRETLIITAKPGMAQWRKHVFEFLSRNARSATSFFQIPPNQVLELGIQIEL